MSNLHANLDEANKHTPKGFDNAATNTRPWKDESNQSTYTENEILPRALNFVDGTTAPPTTTNGHIYVITGTGTVNTGWGSASFNDWVRFANGFPVSISPVTGYLCYDITASQWMEFDGATWAAFGGGGVVSTIFTGGTMSAPSTIAMGGNDLIFDGGKTTLKGSGSTSATTALLVQNSLGTDLLEVKDDGTLLGAFPVEVGSGADSIQQRGATASAINAIALGLGSNVTGNSGIALGQGAISGNLSAALGVQSVANGSQNVSLGFRSECTSSASDSVSIGREATTSTLYAIAIGFQSNVSSDYGIALGQQAISGLIAAALGVQSKANGEKSLALGFRSECTSSASDSVSIGTEARASNNYSLSIGSFMRTAADGAIMIGHGTAARTNSTSNSLEVNFNDAFASTIRLAKSDDSWINTSANFGIGLTAPTAKLHLKGSGSTSATTALLVQNSLGTDLLEVKSSGDTSINGDTDINGGLTVSNNGGSLLTLSNTSTNPSPKMEFKSNGTLETSIGYFTNSNNFEIYKGTKGIRMNVDTGNLSIGSGSYTTADMPLLITKTEASEQEVRMNNNHVTGNFRLRLWAGTITKIDLENTAISNTGSIWADATNGLRLRTNGSDRITINRTTGKVTINNETQINGNLGVFGTTPISQPTTAIAASILGTGAGTGLTDLDTFDGYTLQQVVKALRNLGILA